MARKILSGDDVVVLESAAVADRRPLTASLLIAGLLLPVVGGVVLGVHLTHGHGGDAGHLVGVLHGHHHDAGTVSHTHPADGPRHPRILTESPVVAACSASAVAPAGPIRHAWPSQPSTHEVRGRTASAVLRI